MDLNVQTAESKELINFCQQPEHECYTHAVLLFRCRPTFGLSTLFNSQLKKCAIDSSRSKEVSQSEIKISIIFFSLRLLVRPSIHFYTKLSIFNVNLRFKYLTVLKSDFRLNCAKLNEQKCYFIILRLARFFMKFESKIAALLDTHLLFA